jgi:hypothetical protein
VLKGDNVLVKMMNLLQAIFINGSLWEKKFMYKIHHFGQHIILKMTHKRYIILGHKRNWVQRYSIEPNGQVAQVKAQLESNTCNFLTMVKGMLQVQHTGISYDNFPNYIVNGKFKVRGSYMPSPNDRVQPHHFVIIFHLYVIFSIFSSPDLLLFFSFNFFLALSLVSFPLILAMADLWHARVLLQLCADLEDNEKDEHFLWFCCSMQLIKTVHEPHSKSRLGR